MLYETSDGFFDVLENLNQGVSYFDADLRLVFGNKRCIELLELPEKFGKPGTHLSEYFRYNAKRGEYGEGDIETLVRERLALAKKFEPHVFERTRPDGLILRIEGKKVANRGFVTTYTDVTELRSTQNALEDLNKHLDTLVEQRTETLNIVLDSTKNGISLVDRNLNLIVANQQCCEILGVPKQMLKPGVHFSDIMRYNAIRGEYGEGVVEELVQKRVDLAMKFEPHSFIRERLDGTVIEVVGRPVEHGFVTTFTDITEHKKLEKGLRKANEQLESRVVERTKELVAEKNKAEAASRSKSDFLAHMSHELRTPLNSIIGFSDAAISEVFGPVANTKYKEYFHAINSSGSLLLSLINDILELSRLESGKVKLQETIFDPTIPAHEVLYSLKNSAEEKGVRLKCNLNFSRAKLKADQRRIQQILINLLTNSLKFTEAGGTVELNIHINSNGEAELIVSDTGSGMTRDEIKTAFEPFSQIERNAHVSQEGTGLGLPIVKSLVSLHNGKLQFQSEKGKGTVVTISLPTERIIKVN
ncbi:MAG: PAS-domain containing protein [Sneathiella sp.]|nr:PAS-domain containing protein [Sneathiella sp.]